MVYESANFSILFSRPDFRSYTYFKKAEIGELKPRHGKSMASVFSKFEDTWEIKVIILYIFNNK